MYRVACATEDVIVEQEQYPEMMFEALVGGSRLWFFSAFDGCLDCGADHRGRHLLIIQSSDGNRSLSSEQK